MKRPAIEMLLRLRKPQLANVVAYRVESNEADRRRSQRGRSLKDAEPGRNVVTIYRAVVAETDTFRPMDYVTRSRRFAYQHADHTAAVEEEPAHVIKAIVKTADVYEALNPGEYFYDGPEVKGRVIYRTRTTAKAKPRNPYGKNEADRQDLATPRWFFEKVSEAYGRYGTFALDVCAKKNSAVTDRYLTKKQDGLKQEWARGDGELNWCNPPFGQVNQWLTKAFEEARQHDASTVMLLPFRDPAAKWFYRWAPFAQRITVLVPRLQYWKCGGDGAGFNDNASFCSCLWLITRKGVEAGMRDHRRANVDWWNIGKRPDGARR